MPCRPAVKNEHLLHSKVSSCYKQENKNRQ
uniref:Uncharacterized protein n=1 Tax=Anguilla anguilla TaxID=7936 RepID=A0A0E9R635_ANGAN